MLDSAHVFLGIVPTIWTNDDMPSLGDDISFGQCASEIALAGYQGCAIGHKFPSQWRTLKHEMNVRELQICSAWVGTYFTARATPEQSIDMFQKQMCFLKQLGATDISLAELGSAVHQQPIAALPNRPRFDDSQWTALLKGLSMAAEIAGKSDMRIAYHPHVGTGVQDADDIARLMSSVKAESFTLLLDTAHLYYASVDPLEIAKRYAKRIRHVHLKNIREKVWKESIQDGRSFLDSIVNGVFTVPGDPEGTIDLVPIISTLIDSHFKGWLVVEAEQDPAKATPLIYAQMGRAFLRDVLHF